ncbi:MAG: hypothetical protein D8H98_17495, partial [Prevotella sp.]
TKAKNDPLVISHTFSSLQKQSTSTLFYLLTPDWQPISTPSISTAQQGNIYKMLGDKYMPASEQSHIRIK